MLILYFKKEKNKMRLKEKDGELKGEKMMKRIQSGSVCDCPSGALLFLSVT